MKLVIFEGGGLVRMDALEGVGNVGVLGNDKIEGLLRTVRKDLEAGVTERGSSFEGIRSELVFRRVLARIKQDRRRGLWARRVFLGPRLLRAARRVSALGAALWNSRALRILMP